ncbi:MAG TPA: iron ABC transporter permease [Anaerolineaceae bacterium]
MSAVAARGEDRTAAAVSSVQTVTAALPAVRRPGSRPFWVALALLAASVVLSLAVGSVVIPPGALLRLAFGQLAGVSVSGSDASVYAVIFYQLRLPRTALVALTGAALAGSGAAYQGLFRNPLADPFLIGVASGAGLGAVLAMMVRWPYTLVGLLAVPAAALLAGLATVAVVYALARFGSSLSSASLILAGVAVSSFATSLTSYLMLSSQGELRRAIVWLMGGSAQSGWQPVLAVLPYILVGLGGLALSGHGLNVLQFGDEQAKQLGLPVEHAQLLTIFAASLATAAAVAFSGIIGFVGLVVPHIIRMVCGPDYRRLIPLSILGGAVMLLLSDVLGRIILAPQEVPVGVITALIGAPFFLWVLRRTRQGRG